MRAYRMILLFVCMLCFCCLYAFGALLICGKCGYESEPGCKFCSHCGSGFTPGTEDSAKAGDPKDERHAVAAALSATVTATVVDSELQAASKCLAGRKGWLALFYCENAMALNSIANTDKDMAERVRVLHSQCMAGVKASVKACRTCSGTGSSAGSRTCTACRGTGTVPGKAGLDALKHGYDSALKKYVVLRDAAKWVPVGNSWVPADMKDTLSFRQEASLKRVTGSRCQACAGSGHTSCEKCDGLGKLKCTSRACSNGYVKKKIGQGFDSSQREITAKCEVCGGQTTITCPACEGYGSKACRFCRGSGQLPVCQRCDGDGLKRCDACDGAGIDRKNAVCSECRGCGRILCRTCLGDGRGK